MKKLAVLLPTFNAAAYLNESIDSVLNQTYLDYDLYIYDDCSTDETQKIIESYSDNRIYYRRNNENIGIAKTLNKGLDELLLKYEYVARMDADDWCFPERFQKQLNYLDQHTNVILCGTQGFWLKSFNEISSNAWKYPSSNELIKLNLLFTACFGHSSVIIRSNCFKKYNLKYNEHISTCEDWDLWSRIVGVGKVANLSEFLMKYRILDSSNHRSLKNREKHLKERSKIIANYWMQFNINFTEQEIYDYYYGSEKLSVNEFKDKITVLINNFNFLHQKHSINLLQNEKNSFQYLLVRRILDYWKRANVSRLNPKIWYLIISKVKFINKLKLIKSIIR